MTRELLKSYNSIRAEIVSIRIRLKELRADAVSLGVNIDGMPRARAKGRPTEDVALRLIDTEKHYTERLNQLLSMEKEITYWLESVDDALVVSYVRLKYFQGLSDEDIESALYCSRSTLWRRLDKKLQQMKQ